VPLPQRKKMDCPMTAENELIGFIVRRSAGEPRPFAPG